MSSKHRYPKRKDFSSYRYGGYTLTQTSVLHDPSPGTTYFSEHAALEGAAITTWANQPNWRALVASGRNATTNFDAWRKKMSVEPFSSFFAGTNTFDDDVWTEYQSNDMPFLTVGPASIDSDAVEEASQSALQKALDSMKPQFASQTFLGEARETLRMLKNPANSIRNGVDYYLTNARAIRDHSRTVKTYRKALSDAWLEFSFGVQPFVNDIKSGAEAFAQLAERPRYSTFQGTSQAKSNSPRRLVTSTGAGLPLYIDQASTTIVDCRYSGKIRCSMVTNSFYQGFGLEWQEFIPAAWELAPWSFLIDYVSNVGNLIDASVRINTTDFAYVIYQQRINTRTTEYWYVPESSILTFRAAGHTVTTKPGQCVTDYKQYSRSDLDTLPLPHFQCGFDGMNFKRVLNVGALISASNSDRGFSRRGS